jgi:hypothetical protein
MFLGAVQLDFRHTSLVSTMETDHTNILCRKLPHYYSPDRIGRRRSLHVRERQDDRSILSRLIAAIYRVSRCVRSAHPPKQFSYY